VSSLRTFPLLAEAAWRPTLIGGLSLHLGVTGGLVVVDATGRATVPRSGHSAGHRGGARTGTTEEERHTGRKAGATETGAPRMDT
jgi:hypothetical protein